MQIDRDELYDCVWKEPLKTLGPRFGVSDVALRKICLKADIPVPERGYWAKLQAGKSVIQAKRLRRPPGMSKTVYIGESRHSWAPISREQFLGPIPDAPSFSEPIEDLEARITAAVGKVRPIKSLESAHFAIGKLLQADEVRRQKQAASRYPSPWDDPIFVSPFEIRRLRILNAIFLAVAKNGGRASVGGKDGREISIAVYDTHIHLGLDLPANLMKDLRYERLAKGEAGAKLRLIIRKGWGDKERHAWEDTKDEPIETHLSLITTKIIVTAEVQIREQAAHHHQWWLERRAQILEDEKKEREEAERKRREEIERRRKARIDKLLGQAAALHQADTIRALVARAELELTGEPRDAFNAWSQWALAVASDLDPVGPALLKHDDGEAGRD